MGQKILLVAPNPKRFNTTVVHGGLIYLGEYLYSLGYDVEIDNSSSFGRPNIDRNCIECFQPNVLVVDLFRNELLENMALEHVLDLIGELKLAYKIGYVIGIGSISSSLRDDILKYSDAIDCIIDVKAIYTQLGNKFYPKVVDYIKNYYAGFQKLSESFIKSTSIHIPDNAIVSLAASSGCPKQCSFCSYNANVSGWQSRNVIDLADEIELFWHRYNIRRFALTDNNFGVDPDQNVRRLNSIWAQLNEKGIHPKLSMNISADGLSSEVIYAMRNVGVDIILIGFESFNTKTLRRIYKKNICFDTAIPHIFEAEKAGIKPIISYILFQPWLTLNDLRSEISSIDEFGRHRLVHFAAKSILHVIPRTPIEQRLEKEQLLIRSGFSRTFKFVNDDVGDIYMRLAEWTSKIISGCKTQEDLSKAKIQEWKVLKELVSL